MISSFTGSTLLKLVGLSTNGKLLLERRVTSVTMRPATSGMLVNATNEHQIASTGTSVKSVERIIGKPNAK